MENTLPIECPQVPTDKNDSKTTQRTSKPRPLESKNVKNAPRTCINCNPPLADNPSAVPCKCQTKSKAPATGLENAADTSNTQGAIPMTHTIFSDTQNVKKRRERFTFNKKQVTFLNMAFVRTQYPDTLARSEIGTQLEIPETTIQVWFKNKRAKVRKERLTHFSRSQTPVDPTTQTYNSHLLPQPNAGQTPVENYFKMNSAYGHGIQAEAVNLNPHNSASSCGYPNSNNFYYMTSGIAPSNEYIHPSILNLQVYHPSLNNNTYNQNGVVTNGYNFTNRTNRYYHPYITTTHPSASAVPNGYQYYSSTNQQPSKSISTSGRKENFFNAPASNNPDDIPPFGTSKGSAR